MYISIPKKLKNYSPPLLEGSETSFVFVQIILYGTIALLFWRVLKLCVGDFISDFANYSPPLLEGSETAI